MGISGSGTAEGKIAEAMAVHYTYNDRGYLTNVKTDNGLDASYTYDVSERRRSKTVNGVTTNHIWDGQNIVRKTGEKGERKPPHSNPKPNPFGEQAKKEYDYMRQLLGLE